MLYPYVTCMYVVRTDHLTLDSLLVCGSLGKTTSPTPKSHGIFSVCFGICIGAILFSSYLGIHNGVTLRQWEESK